MANRKKWRLQLLPTFRYESATSKVDAYRKVERYRDDYALGVTRVHHVNVEVNEGSAWTRYERIIFPEPTS